MTSTSITIQLSPASAPALPCWFAEVTTFAQVLSHMGIKSALIEGVYFARAHFGQYDLIDFIVVLHRLWAFGRSAMSVPDSDADENVTHSAKASVRKVGEPSVP